MGLVSLHFLNYFWEKLMIALSPASQCSKLAGGANPIFEDIKDGEEIVKRRRVSEVKEESENAQSGDEYFTATPAVVSLGPGVKIISVAAGGRHTLALSDMGQVWGWGCGGEGQLGLGSRVKIVSSPRLIPCTGQPAPGKERSSVVHQGSTNLSAQVSKYPKSYVKEIACGGRHSAVVTDAGELLTFGWGLYGQCGQGSTNDQLSPTSLPSLSGIKVERIAAGLWHSLCIAIDGRVYAFGGNQFGQLGTGADHGESIPRLLDAPCLESKQAKMVSCGARHSAIITVDGQVFSWGWNKYGQLGVGDSMDRNIPSQVPIEGCRPKSVACGWWHTLLLAETPLKS
uniref:RCC1-like domain-containing protein n=1 Tax=Salix viminalis TaxID=40686 RepID=A0A6N2KIT2_SALVM